MPDRLLTVEESRKRLQVSRATLYHLINSGHLQSVLLGPQSRRIVESSVDALIAARAHVMELVAPGAFTWYTGSSPAKIAYVLLGLLGLAIVVYVAVPVLKALGVCWSAKIKAHLMPSKQQRSRRGRTRKR